MRKSKRKKKKGRRKKSEIAVSKLRENKIEE